MDTAERRRVLTEAVAARARMRQDLEQLIRDRDTVTAELARDARWDVVKRLTGKSSLERAVEQAERAIEGLDRVIAAAQRAEFEHPEAREAEMSPVVRAVVRLERLGARPA